jgi:small nuclear ribonucleoprotein (snRNP)-like protein
MLLAHCQPQYCSWKCRSECSLSLNLFELMVAVKLNANRNVIGVLRGFDQFMNLVLDNTLEVNGNDTTEIGMVVSVPTSVSLSSFSRHPTHNSGWVLYLCINWLSLHCHLYHPRCTLSQITASPCVVKVFTCLCRSYAVTAW